MKNYYIQKVTEQGTDFAVFIMVWCPQARQLKFHKVKQDSSKSMLHSLFLELIVEIDHDKNKLLKFNYTPSNDLEFPYSYFHHNRSHLMQAVQNGLDIQGLKEVDKKTYSLELAGYINRAKQLL